MEHPGLQEAALLCKHFKFKNPERLLMFLISFPFGKKSMSPTVTLGIGICTIVLDIHITQKMKLTCRK